MHFFQGNINKQFCNLEYSLNPFFKFIIAFTDIAIYFFNVGKNKKIEIIALLEFENNF